MAPASKQSLKHVLFQLTLVLLVIINQNVVFAQGETGAKGSLTDLSTESADRPLSTQLFDKFSKGINFKDLDPWLAHEELSATVALEALREFQACNLEKFDPTAGDTSCQVRTHKLLSLDLERKFRDGEVPRLIAEFQDSVAKIKEVRRQLLDVFDPKGDVKRKKDVGNQLKLGGAAFLKSHGISTPQMSDDAVFVVLSHFVTRYHSEIASILERKKELIDHTYDDLTSKTLHGMMDNARTKLSFLTFQHAGALSDEVKQTLCDDEKAPSLPPELKDQINTYHALMQEVGKLGPFKSRATYPGFYLLFADMWKKKMVLMFKDTIFCPEHGMHKVDFFYVAGDKPFEFVPYKGDPKDMLEKNVAVIEGVTDLTGQFSNQSFYTLGNSMEDLYEKHNGTSTDNTCPRVAETVQRIKDTNFTEMMLANAAKHPQYVDKAKKMNFAVLEQSKAKEYESSFEAHCRLAENKGMCMENMDLLRLTHIFPSKAKNSLGKVKVDVDHEILENIEKEMVVVKARRAEEHRVVELIKQELERSRAKQYADKRGK